MRGRPVLCITTGSATRTNRQRSDLTHHLKAGGMQSGRNAVRAYLGLTGSYHLLVFGFFQTQQYDVVKKVYMKIQL